MHNSNMKIQIRHITFLFLTFALISCTSPEEKARHIFEETLLPRMGNPDLYEFVSMTPLDSAYSSLNIDRSYLSLKDSLKKYTISKYDVMLPKQKYHKKKQQEEKYKNAVREYEESFKSEFIGWHSTIEFRAENLLGAKWLYSAEVYFDKDITELIDFFPKAQ